MKSVLNGVMDKVITTEVIEEKITSGGIVMPETTQTVFMKSVVVSKGNEVTEEIDIGDFVYCFRQAAMAVVIGDTIYNIIKATDVYGTVKGEK